MLNIEGLSKRFPRNNFLFRKTSYVDALNNISFQINEGDFVGVIGRNGSGKSTLLQLISNLMTPSDGKIIYSLDDIEIDKELFIKKIIFSAPYQKLVEELTVKSF